MRRVARNRARPEAAAGSTRHDGDLLELVNDWTSGATIAAKLDAYEAPAGP
jgi:hypothetical protein